MNVSVSSSIAPAPARFVTHPGMAPAPSTLQNLSAKWQQLNFRTSYLAPGHSGSSAPSSLITARCGNAVMPICTTSLKVWFWDVRGTSQWIPTAL